MSLVEQQDAHAEWLERKADAHDERRRAELEAIWDDCLKQRNLDAPIGGGYYSDLIEVLGDACSDSDQAINCALMQAVIDCAEKGQPEAVAALELVKGFFINKTMELENGK